MKSIAFLTAASLLAAPAFAVMPAKKPAAPMIALTCKDGTSSAPMMKPGACAAHGGVVAVVETSTAATVVPAGTVRSATARTPTGGKTTATTASSDDSASATRVTQQTSIPVAMGVSAVCKDNSAYSGKWSKSACSGHGGVKAWTM